MVRELYLTSQRLAESLLVMPIAGTAEPDVFKIKSLNVIKVGTLYTLNNCRAAGKVSLYVGIT